MARALAHCERFAKAPCRLYAVDGAVVWPGERPAAALADKPAH
jgi:hypothetical protein